MENKTVTNISFQNNFQDLKIQFERETGIKIDTNTLPIYLDYLKAIMSDRIQQTLAHIHNDMVQLINKIK